MSSPSRRGALLAAGLLAVSTRARADAPPPGADLAAPGPQQGRFTRLAASLMEKPGPERLPLRALRADLYCQPPPAGAAVARVPLVVIVPDEGRPGDDAAPLAAHLASYGLAVLTPTLEAHAPEARAEQLRGAIEAVLDRSGPETTDPVVACFRQQELRTVLFVWVGRGALLAPAVLASLSLVRNQSPSHPPPFGVFLAPPSAGPVASFPALETPPDDPQSLVVRLAPGACGDGGSAYLAAEATLHSTMAVTADQATLCDALGTVDSGCAARCGAGAPGARPALRRSITAWLLWLSQGPELSGTPGWGAYQAPVRRPLAALAGLESATVGPPRLEQPAAAQFNLSLVAGLGVALRGPSSAGGALGFRPEVVFGRRSDAHLGVGFYGEVLSTGLGMVQLGGGASLVLPLTRNVALVPSAGTYGSTGEGGVQAGARAGAYLGGRRYNGISHFDGSFGLRADAGSGLGSRAERLFVVSGQFDLMNLVALGALAGNLR